MVNQDYLKRPPKGCLLPLELSKRVDKYKGNLSRNAYMVRIISHYMNLVEGGHINPAGNKQNERA